MLPPKAGGEVSLLVRVIDRDLRLERHLAGEPKGTPYFGHEEDFGRPFEDIIPRCLRSMAMDGACEGGGSEETTKVNISG